MHPLMCLTKQKYLVPATSHVSAEHTVRSSIRRIAKSLIQGFLTKLGEKVKNWKRRYFILRAGVVYYYKKNDVRLSISG